MSKRFANKVVLVTGASSGIGEVSARAFAAEGARVCLAARREPEGSAVADAIRAAGGEASFVKADMAKREDIRAMVDHCVRQYGGLDIAFNNAGLEGAHGVDTESYSDAMWDRVLAVNLSGVWSCMKAELPHLVSVGGGAIVNMSSIAGLKGFAGASAYGASKFGVIGITKGAALEYADRGIRINAVCPGIIKTPLADRVFLGDPQRSADVLKEYPGKRVGTPEEVAAAVLWLCSDEASFVNGTALAIDGGRTA